MEELEFLISQYVDGELEPELQGDLFKELSLNPEARELFEEYLDLKKEINRGLSNHINISLTQKAEKKSFKYKTAFYSSVAVMVIAILVTITTFETGTPERTELLVNTDTISNSIRENQKSGVNNLYLQKVNKMRTVKITDKDLIGKKL